MGFRVQPMIPRDWDVVCYSYDSGTLAKVGYVARFSYLDPAYHVLFYEDPAG